MSEHLNRSRKPRGHGKISDEAMADLLLSPLAVVDDATEGDELELTELRSALSSYRTETLVWAERRSAGQPPLAAAARRAGMWTTISQWSAAGVAVAAVAVGAVFFAGHRDAEESAGVARTTISVTAPASASQADIAADNRLLSSIDDALNYHESTPVDGFGLKPAHAGVRTAAHTEVTD